MQLSNRTITICSTARLARGVRLLNHQSHLNNGVLQWQSAEVYTLPQWLDDLMGNAILLGILPSNSLPSLILSEIAEAFLWEHSIETCLSKHETAALFDIHALRKSAIEANNLLFNWQISEADISQYYIRQETRQFLRWRHTFHSLCVKHNAIERARLTEIQVELIEEHNFHLLIEMPFPKKVILAGFDRITPLEKRLFDFLISSGVIVEMLTANISISPNVEYFPLNDSHAECRAAVAWAKKKLDENPKIQLAIISPVLGNIRREIADLLDDTFHPETLQPNQYEAPRCYDFSLGLALTEYPIVHSALQLLRIASTSANVSFEDVTSILQDVYWGNQTEIDARSQLDAYLRQKLNASYNFGSLLNLANKLKKDGVQLDFLIEHLAAILQFQNYSQQRQLPSHWVEVIKLFLDTLNWSQTRQISSHEYQSHQAFLKCLIEFGTLDTILGKITVNEAVRKITELCNSTIFQVESIGDVHIQMLGLLETPAVKLDAVWVLNINDQDWPPSVKLNPLLPAELQHRRGTPNASAGSQSEFAALVHERLISSAPEIVFSYSVKEGERELRPSPLLDIKLNNIVIKQPETIQTLSEHLAQPASMQILDDNIAPPISVSEKVHGGVKLFAAQAICPAWAFYQYRLGANKLKIPIDGLDNISRGSLMHKVLQFFWQDCLSLSKLKVMDDKQRIAAIDRAIDKSIHALRCEMNFNFPPQVLQIEQERLSQLMQYWLDVELGRAEFSVLECEKKFKLDVEGLPLSLTIDRIDKLTEGGLVVIDYKSSALVTNKSWAEDRMSEPQLPIYASLALMNEDVVAVCFAKLRTDDTKFIGISVEENLLPDVASLSNSNTFKYFKNWDDLLQHWHTSLTNIAQEIKSGIACITFKKESDLAYCDVKTLLRLPERMLQFEKLQASQSEGDNT